MGIRLTPLAKTNVRGYGRDHQQERARWQRRLDLGETILCWRCGARIHPLEPWDLGHDDHDRTVYRGPEHRRCNRGAGGRSALLRRRVTALEW